MESADCEFAPALEVEQQKGWNRLIAERSGYGLKALTNGKICNNSIFEGV